MTVAFALIPEAIAFSILAGVDPMVGLYASFCIAVTISLIGGRMGMISAATGAMAIIIFLAQLPNFRGANWQMYLMVACTLAIVYLLPLITKAVPSALVAIIVMTILSITMHLDLRTVGDMGPITQALPFFHLPNIELSLHTIGIIFPFSMALAVVGITESLMTATIVDEMTETKSDKNKEVRGQGIANVVSGCFGGMAGCAMIGQTVINVKSGGRSRLSTLVAGVFLLFLILVLGNVVRQIPMAALVGVMFMVSIGTFDWNSLKTLTKIPLSDASVMVVTVAIVVATSDLAIGVVSGVALSALIFGWRSAKIKAHAAVENNTKIYHISGQLFFGTMAHFVDLFDYKNDPQTIKIDFSSSHVWDHSAVTAIAKAALKYQQIDKKVTITGLNEESKKLVDQVGLAVPSGH